MVKIYKLADGTFIAEVGGIELCMTEQTVLENFALDSIPEASIFVADPRSVQEYLEIRSR